MAPITPREFGAMIRFEAEAGDPFDVLGSITRDLRDASRAAIDTEVALAFLRAAHPRRARRWRQAADEHGKWLAALYPPHPTAVCEMCGQALPDYDDDDWDD